MFLFLKKTILFLVILSILSINAVCADTITERIDLAKKKYLEGRYNEAISELNFVAGLIKQKRAERLKVLLPKPPAGWKGEEPQSGAAPVFLGGGISVSRTYYNDAGSRVEVSIVSDAPLLSSLLMMLSNPAFVGAGNTITMVKGEKALEEWNPSKGSGKLTIAVGEQLIVTVEGSNLASKKDLYRFAELLDFEKIRKMTGGK